MCFDLIDVARQRDSTDFHRRLLLRQCVFLHTSLLSSHHGAPSGASTCCLCTLCSTSSGCVLLCALQRACVCVCVYEDASVHQESILRLGWISVFTPPTHLFLARQELASACLSAAVFDVECEHACVCVCACIFGIFCEHEGREGV